jgi:dihydrofolate reductase
LANYSKKSYWQQINGWICSTDRQHFQNCFSHSLKNVDWKNTKLKKEVIKEEVLELKQQAGKNILVGSPSLIVALMQLDLIDEYQLCVQPIILGNGLPLFKNINDRINLKLLKTKTFGSGSITLYYEPAKKWLMAWNKTTSDEE